MEAQGSPQLFEQPGKRANPVISNQRGFTLVEIMTVVMIIGVMVGLAVINIGGRPERELKLESQRLFQKMRLLVDEAEFSGSELGLVLGEDGVLFVEFDQAAMQWAPADPKRFSPLHLAAEYTLALNLDGNEVDNKILFKKTKQSKEEAEDDTEENVGFFSVEPDIFFFSDGQLTPFELRIGHKNIPKLSYLIRGVNPGRLSISSESQ